MATAEQLREANKKAVLSPKIGKHGKRKSTLLKERARLEYEKEILKEFMPIVKVQKKEAKKAKNVDERKYVINQIIGSPKERLEVQGYEFEFDENE